MEIRRIDTYIDKRFSKACLLQHGCFLIGNDPYEVRIISDSEALIYGKDRTKFRELIEEFRFYSPQITSFRDQNGNIIKEYPKIDPVTILLDDIQPSQFYVDEEKLTAIATFINKPDDIIIQAIMSDDRYIAVDGHTRMYHALLNGYSWIKAIIVSSDDYIYSFVDEARKRGVYRVHDMVLLEHDNYVIKWNRFCEEFFKATSSNK